MGKPKVTRTPSDKKYKSKIDQSPSDKSNLKDKASDRLSDGCQPVSCPSVWIMLTLIFLIALIFLAGFPWQGMTGIQNAEATLTTCSTKSMSDQVSTNGPTIRYNEVNADKGDTKANQQDGLVEQRISRDCGRSSSKRKAGSFRTSSCGNGDRCPTNRQCVDGADGYTCICNEGYYGANCDAALVDCERLRCNSHGECRRRIGTQEVYCACAYGYSGDNCETESVSPCSNALAPCSGHGRCIDLADGSHVCLCNDGYYGTSCNDTIDECDSNPCFHGNCTDVVNGFYCDCEFGYEGVQCQIDIDDCTANPCGSNGRCLNLPNKHVCICNVGYTGADCHSVCDEEPCFNNATCSLCDGGACNGTGLPFRCTCTENATYGVLCTDRDGFWSQWSEWTDTPTDVVERLETDKFSAPMANCSYTNRTRTRECTPPVSAGADCEGLAYEEAIVDASCECLLCCASSLACGPFDIAICFCNEACLTSSFSPCCISNAEVCSTTTPVERDDLF